MGRLPSASAQRGAFAATLCLAIALTGCTSAMRVSPTLPNASAVTGSPSRVGVYIPPGREYDLKPGSGIWPGTTYVFSPEETVQEGLAVLTKRHFKNAGLAENAGDKRWDYVLEYQCEQPIVRAGGLESHAPLRFILRDPDTGRELQPITLTGEGSAQGGRVFRLFFGRLAEKRSLERSLEEAYSNLFVSVDGNLARTAASLSQATPERNYRPGRRTR